MSQVVSIGEKEAILDLDLTEDVQVLGFFVSVQIGRCPEQWYHLGVHNLVDTMHTNLCHFLACSDQDEIEAFEKAHKAKYTMCHLYFGGDWTKFLLQLDKVVLERFLVICL